MTKQMVKSGNTLITHVPGIEGVDDRDRRRGNIILVQDNSKFFTSQGHKPGTFVNTSNNKKVENTEFVPCYLTKYYDVYEYTLGRAKWLFRTIDDKDVRLENKRWRQEGNDRAEIVSVICCVALLEGQPVQIAFKKLSGYPAGQRLYSFAADKYGRDNTALYGWKYKLTAKQNHSKSGEDFWSIDVDEVGPSSETETSIGSEIARQLSGKRSEVAKEASEDDIPF